MRLAVSAQGCSLTEMVDERFGRCPYFLICDPDNPQISAEYKENPALSGTGGAGIAAAEFMVQEKVEVLITGSLGPNAQRVIKAAKIPAYSAAETQTVLGAIEAWKNGRLNEIS